MVKIAVVGAKENLGREILGLLSENDVNVDNVIALEPKSPLGTLVSYGEDEDLDVLNLDDFDFAKADVVLFACTEEVAKRYLPKAMSKGVKIVDCSGATSADADVPMIVAGLNNEAIKEAKKNVVSVPMAVVTQVLKPLSKVNEKYGAIRIVLSGYLSTSFHSHEAMDELFSQTRKIYMNMPLVDDEEIFKKQIAFNVLPQVGEFIGEETKAEWAVNAEIKKVLGGNMKIHANLAYVPAFIGAGVFANVETASDVDIDDVKNLMGQTKGIVVFDKQTDGGYVSLNDIQGENDIYISRLRQDLSAKNGFSFWAVADNLRADSARNAVDVMELLLTK
ncbi:MAG TPA: aspartate-semialdehyde dehydrogenase [Alphaproteobacteria bacterium]|nr:aspartate-semialdehyde dehydrogenase [Alphaproteobacteria bacterium]